MHPFQHLKIMCTLAAEALYKQGNMSLIKISFISLLIKRLSLIIEFSAPPPGLFVSFLCSQFYQLPLCGCEKKDIFNFKFFNKPNQVVSQSN